MACAQRTAPAAPTDQAARGRPPEPVRRHWKAGTPEGRSLRLVVAPNRWRAPPRLSHRRRDKCHARPNRAVPVPLLRDRKIEENNVGPEAASLLAAFGLGSIITTMVQSFLSARASKRQLSYNEGKEAYIGLLKAYRRAAAEQTKVASIEAEYWRFRCELVAPKSVRDAVDMLFESERKSSARAEAEELMKAAFRNDLGVASTR